MIERQFYPLPTIAERWGCTVSDLLHLGIQDRLQICVNIYGIASGMRRSRICLDASEDEQGEVQPESEEEDSTFEAWMRRTTVNMPAGVFELDIDSIRFIDMPDGLPFELNEARKFDDGWWNVEFDPSITIKLEHLCLLHEEVKRLDGMDIEKLHLEAIANEAVNALSDQLDILLKRYWRFAESRNIDSDVARLHKIGNWQRIMMLDRLGGAEGFEGVAESYLSPSDLLLLRECSSFYNLDDDQANRDWQAAGDEECLVAFGIHVYCRIVAGEATTSEAIFLFGLACEIAGSFTYGNIIQGSELTNLARYAANIRHSKPGGSRDKRQQIRAIWATGKYTDRTTCAEQEFAALGWSYDSARKALRNTPNPDPWPAKKAGS